MSQCPECGATIENDMFETGEIIECPDCGVELEVISTEPLRFELLEEEEK